LGLDRGADARDLVGRQVVEDHDIAWAKHRCQASVDLSEEDGPFHRPVDDEGGSDAVLPLAGEEGGGLSMIGWTPRRLRRQSYGAEDRQGRHPWTPFRKKLRREQVLSFFAV
jgi:hypothetical protein